MKNTIGNAVTMTLFGESHGDSIGVVLDGLCPGVPVNRALIERQLDLRRPFGAISTARREPDVFELLSGVYEGKTTGTPLCIRIPNTQTRSADYDALRTVARPGHADYTAYAKYHGFSDPRGGGHFSGRLTAPIVAAGAILLGMLRQKGIVLGTHISRCAGIADRPFSDCGHDLALLNEKQFAVLDDSVGEAMQSAILAAAADGDSVGGVLETAVLGMPAGVGEPWFDGVESALARGLFAIPAVKGVEFGDGFAIAELRGSVANDPITVDGARVVTLTNRNGGIGGGITNGMPILFRTAIKPTPSIFKSQDTIDFVKNEPRVLSLGGRHDPAIVHRARVVVDSITALILVDLLTGRFGTDWWKENA
jgi:chorismate synthase